MQTNLEHTHSEKKRMLVMKNFSSKLRSMIKSTMINRNIKFTEENQLRVAQQIISNHLNFKLIESLRSTRTLIDCCNYLESDLEKKLVLATLGLEKNDIMAEIFWHARFLAGDSLTYILNSIHKESDKQLLIDFCIPAATLISSTKQTMFATTSATEETNTDNICNIKSFS